MRRRKPAVVLGWSAMGLSTVLSSVAAYLSAVGGHGAIIAAMIPVIVAAALVAFGALLASI
jgi:hypothetical protein